MPAAFASASVVDVTLERFAMDDNKLFVNVHPLLYQLVRADQEGLALGRRLVRLAEGHPATLSRWASLAGDRDALVAALDP